MITPATSATGGYLLPSGSTTGSVFPKKLTLQEFLQTILVGISGIQGDLVRPKEQINPPKMPDILTNWIAFHVNESVPDANAYNGLNSAGQSQSQRQERLELALSIYGPDSFEISRVVRDGLWVQQNLELMRAYGMGLVEVSRIIHMPELINERWFQRFDMSVFLNMETLRTYRVLPLESANGIIATNTTPETIKPWQVQE